MTFKTPLKAAQATPVKEELGTPKDDSPSPYKKFIQPLHPLSQNNQNMMSNKLKLGKPDKMKFHSPSDKFSQSPISSKLLNNKKFMFLNKLMYDKKQATKPEEDITKDERATNSLKLKLEALSLNE